VGFGARDFVHGANAAKPRKLRTWAVGEAKIHVLRESKNTQKLLKIIPAHGPRTVCLACFNCKYHLNLKSKSKSKSKI